MSKRSLSFIFGFMTLVTLLAIPVTGQQTSTQSSPSDAAEKVQREIRDTTREQTKYTLWMVYVGGLAVVVQGFLLWYQGVHTAKAANAAKDSALALINAERAWILVEAVLNLHGSSGTHEHGDGTLGFTATAVILCTNYGKTPGWVIEKKVGLIITSILPDTPRLDRTEIAQASPELVAPQKTTSIEWFLRTDGNPGKIGNCAVLFGSVLYEDIFGKRRETRFAYMFNPDLGSMERLTGRPEWNKQT